MTGPDRSLASDQKRTAYRAFGAALEACVECGCGFAPLQNGTRQRWAWESLAARLRVNSGWIRAWRPSRAEDIPTPELFDKLLTELDPKDDEQRTAVQGLKEAFKAADAFRVRRAGRFRPAAPGPAPASAGAGAVSYAKPFRLAPIDVQHFVGRGMAMFRLKQVLLGRRPARAVGIWGGPGYGKSALAARFAWRFGDEFPDGVLTVDWRAYRSAEAVAQVFAEQVGQPVDPSQEGKLSAFDIIQSRFLRRRCLLVIDNLDRGNPAGLTPQAGSQLLITSRDRELLLALGIPLVAIVEATPLRRSEELALLAIFLGREQIREERRAALALLDVVRGHSLATRIAALSIAAGISDSPISRYVERLEKQRQVLLDYFLLKNDFLPSLRAVFEISLDLLTQEQQQTFCSLSVCPPSGFGHAIAAATVGLSDEPQMADEHLSRLVNLGLLEYGVLNDRFRFHPLVLAFADEISRGRNLRDSAFSRFAEHMAAYVRRRAEYTPANIQQLRDEQESIFRAAEYRAGIGHFDYHFLTGFNILIEQTGQWQKAGELVDLALRQPNIMSPIVTASLYLQRGKHRTELGLLREAIKDFDQSVVLMTAQHNERGLTMALNSRGVARRDLGDLEGALDDLSRAVDLSERIGGDERGLAITLNSRAMARRDIGDLEGALRDASRSAELTAGRGDERSLAMALNIRGGIRRDLGDLEGALDDLSKAATLREQVGDERGLAITLNGRARVRRDLGDLDGALADFVRLRALLKTHSFGIERSRVKAAHKTLRKFHNSLATAADEQAQNLLWRDFYFELAKGYVSKANEPAQSIILYKRLLKMKEIGELKSICLFGLGKACFKLKRYEAAVEHFLDALENGHSGSEIHADLAHSMTQLGRPIEETRAHYEMAIRGETNPWAESWYGLALSAAGEHEKAEKYARSAVTREPHHRHSALLLNLARVLDATGDPFRREEAIEIARLADKLAPPGFRWPRVFLAERGIQVTV